jgi:hypothetical protein
MGITESKIDKNYNDLVYMFDILTCGFDTPYECYDRLKFNSDIIIDHLSELVKKKPELFMNVIKVYPQVKEYLFEILGNDEYSYISYQLDSYYL